MRIPLIAAFPAILAACTLLLHGKDAQSRSDPGPTPKPASPRPATPPRVSQLKGAQARRWIDERVAETGKAVFTSADGVLHGLDNDAQVIFKADGQVELVIYGIGVVSYFGSFSIDAQGAIVLSLDNNPPKWKVMYLYPDVKGAFLLPKGLDPSPWIGRRKDERGIRQTRPYWLFRYQQKPAVSP